MLGALGMVDIKNIFSWPPTFDVESRRPNVKKNYFNFFHGDLGMVETKIFSLGLLLLTSKVGGKEPQKLPLPCFELLSFMLGVLCMAKINFV